jgi:hypothetical protein
MLVREVLEEAMARRNDPFEDEPGSATFAYERLGYDHCCWALHLHWEAFAGSLLRLYV